MQNDDRQYLLRVALEMRLLARARVLDGSASLSHTQMTEIAEQLERIGRSEGGMEGERARARRVGRM